MNESIFFVEKDLFSAQRNRITTVFKSGVGSIDLFDVDRLILSTYESLEPRSIVRLTNDPVGTSGDWWSRFLFFTLRCSVPWYRPMLVGRLGATCLPSATTIPHAAMWSIFTISGTISSRGASFPTLTKKKKIKAKSKCWWWFDWSIFFSELFHQSVFHVHPTVNQLFSFGFGSREERRWIEKQNKAERARRKKEEMSRLRSLVDAAYACDPRILRFKEEDKQKKLDAKKAKQDAVRARQEEEERVYNIHYTGLDGLFFLSLSRSLDDVQAILVGTNRIICSRHPSFSPFWLDWIHGPPVIHRSLVLPGYRYWRLLAINLAIFFHWKSSLWWRKMRVFSPSSVDLLCCNDDALNLALNSPFWRLSIYSEMELDSNRPWAQCVATLTSSFSCFSCWAAYRNGGKRRRTGWESNEKPRKRPGPGRMRPSVKKRAPSGRWNAKGNSCRTTASSSITFLPRKRNLLLGWRIWTSCANYSPLMSKKIYFLFFFIPSVRLSVCWYFSFYRQTGEVEQKDGTVGRQRG